MKLTKKERNLVESIELNPLSIVFDSIDLLSSADYFETNLYGNTFNVGCKEMDLDKITEPRVREGCIKYLNENFVEYDYEEEKDVQIWTKKELDTLVRDIMIRVGIARKIRTFLNSK